MYIHWKALNYKLGNIDDPAVIAFVGTAMNGSENSDGRVYCILLFYKEHIQNL